jgi:hypothetical protein
MPVEEISVGVVTSVETREVEETSDLKRVSG